MTNQDSLPAQSDLPLVLVDARMVGEIPHGIARYVMEFTQGLIALHAHSPLPYRISFLVGPRSHLSSLLQSNPSGAFQAVECPIPFLHWTESWRLGSWVRRLRARAFHSPSFSSHRKCKVAYAVTLHDLIHTRFGHVLHRIYFAWIVRPFVRRATLLASVSEASARRIQLWLGTKSPIRVIENALTLHLPKSIPSKSGSRYLLAITQPKSHKNNEALLRAYEAYRQSVEEPLELWWTLTQEGGLGVQALGPISEDRRIQIVQGAVAVVAYSLEEGFGLVPVEALVLGRPVIASSIEAHHEALHKALQGASRASESGVRWVDPHHEADLVTAMRAAHSGEIAPPERAVGDALRARFNRERLASQTDQLYRDLLGIPS